MTEAEFRQELKCLNGGYVLYGEEDYLKFSYSREAQKYVLDGMFDDFNHIVIYGEEFTPFGLSNALATLPMMSEKKLVEIRGVDFNSLKKDEIKELEQALMSMEENSSHTVLIIRADSNYFNAGRLPKAPSELYKMMSKYLKMVQFDFPTPARLRSWILKHFSKWEIGIDTSLCDKMVDICGHDMWALSNEIEKLCAYAKMNNLSVITINEIDNVCCKTVEYDDFRLTNALLDRNKDLVFETLRRQKATHEPPFSILSSVIRLYMEMYLVSVHFASGMNKTQISEALGIHEFKVGKYINAISGVNPKRLERAVELCREADVKSKSYSNMVSYIPVERLISSLCALFCR
ncbi:MAG: DNA polymerase III subunit delta [Clostridia bacterium]|nr:DNA polymerase III subunit delta [Clostridia bacterium]